MWFRGEFLRDVNSPPTGFIFLMWHSGAHLLKCLLGKITKVLVPVQGSTETTHRLRSNHLAIMEKTKFPTADLHIFVVIWPDCGALSSAAWLETEGRSGLLCTYSSSRFVFPWLLCIHFLFYFHQSYLYPRLLPVCLCLILELVITQIYCLLSSF